MTPEQLEAIEGIGPKTVEKISLAVNNYFAGLEGGEAAALPENEGGPVAGQEAGAVEEGAAVEESAAPDAEAAVVETAAEEAQPESEAQAPESQEAVEAEEKKE
jgi:N utilization substance protein A